MKEEGSLLINPKVHVDPTHKEWLQHITQTRPNSNEQKQTNLSTHSNKAN